MEVHDPISSHYATRYRYECRALCMDLCAKGGKYAVSFLAFQFAFMERRIVADGYRVLDINDLVSLLESCSVLSTSDQSHRALHFASPLTVVVTHSAKVEDACLGQSIGRNLQS